MATAAPALLLRASKAAVLVVLVSSMLLLLTAPASSQPASPGPAPAAAAPGGGMDSACMNSLLNMSDCLTFVEKGSSARRPEAPCCPELAGMVGSNPVCLCALLSGAADSYGIAVDYSRALALPGICRVSTPPVSTCAALGYHVNLGPAAAPVAGGPSSTIIGISPAAEGPQFPGSSPFASPPSTTSQAARRFSSGHIATLAAVLPLAAAAISGML